MIGTWNVRMMLQTGKLENIIIEMERLKLKIFGLYERRWPNSRNFGLTTIELFIIKEKTDNAELVWCYINLETNDLKLYRIK